MHKDVESKGGYRIRLDGADGLFLLLLLVVLLVVVATSLRR